MTDGTQDFEYRSEDGAHIRGSFHGLRIAEDKAFFWSNLTGLPLGIYLGYRRNWGIMGIGLSALVSGSMVFYALTYLPRSKYEKVAQKVNRTYAITIGKILQE